jgi:hypothetical protein
LIRQITPVVLVFLILILFFMLAELAAAGVFRSFATAPPHFTAIVGLMGTTTPVEILFFQEVFATLLADLRALVKFATAAFEFFDAVHHFLAFSDQQLVLLIHVLEVFSRDFKLLLEGLDVFLHLGHTLLECFHRDHLLLLDSIFDFEEFLGLLPELITL